MLQWNLGGTSEAQFYDLVTLDASVRTHQLQGLTTGEIYKFRVLAVNALVTPGPPSGVLAVYAATVPLQPSTPIKVTADQN